MKFEQVNEKNGEFESTQSASEKKNFSVGWLIFWIIFFWPVAIVYYVTKR